jgi:hypothetical protein
MMLSSIVIPRGFLEIEKWLASILYSLSVSMIIAAIYLLTKGIFEMEYMFPADGKCATPALGKCTT